MTVAALAAASGCSARTVRVWLLEGPIRRDDLVRLDAAARALGLQVPETYRGNPRTRDVLSPLPSRPRSSPWRAARAQPPPQPPPPDEVAPMSELLRRRGPSATITPPRAPVVLAADVIREGDGRRGTQPDLLAWATRDLAADEVLP